MKMTSSYKYYYIDTTRECVNIVENFLSTQTVIAIDCEGVRLSKEGQLTLLQISLPDKRVFLFDILKGGSTMFDGLVSENKKGLKYILEKRNILKLIHDCRSDWDSLLHQYNVRLFNFIDTQEAYFIYKLIYDGEITLPLSLSKFIEYFSKTQLSHKESMKDEMKENPLMWGERPLTEKQLEYASEDVVYLIESWNKISEYFSKNIKELVSVLSILKVVERNLFDEFKEYLISQIMFIRSTNKTTRALDAFLNIDFTYIFLQFKSLNKQTSHIIVNEETKEISSSPTTVKTTIKVDLIESGLQYKMESAKKRTEIKQKNFYDNQYYSKFDNRRNNNYNNNKYNNGGNSSDEDTSSTSPHREEYKCKETKSFYNKKNQKKTYYYSGNYNNYYSNYNNGYDYRY